MSKHIGTMLAWILIAGAVLYLFRVFPDILRFAQHTKGIDVRSSFKLLDWFFK